MGTLRAGIGPRGSSVESWLDEWIGSLNWEGHRLPRRARRDVTGQDAEAWFGIRPPGRARNVTPGARGGVREGRVSLRVPYHLFFPRRTAPQSRRMERHFLLMGAVSMWGGSSPRRRTKIAKVSAKSSIGRVDA